MSALHTFFFSVYPYICLAVFLMGSLARFDRDQYTWKSDSSQLLRSGQLRWGSNLFHVGVLFLFFGHFAGMLTPHFVYEPFITAGQKQVLAMTAGGIAGTGLLKMRNPLAEDILATHEEALAAGIAVRALGDRCDGHIVDAEIGEDLECHR